MRYTLCTSLAHKVNKRILQNPVADLQGRLIRKHLRSEINDRFINRFALYHTQTFNHRKLEIFKTVYAKAEELENAVSGAKAFDGDALKSAQYYRDKILSVMSETRISIDELETLIAKKYWAFPTYGEILYSVN